MFTLPKQIINKSEINNKKLTVSITLTKNCCNDVQIVSLSLSLSLSLSPFLSLSPLCSLPLSPPLSLSLQPSLSHTACEVGFYKPMAGDGLCGRCPLQSHSETRAALYCPCDSSHYRAPTDPPAAPCTSPPTAPVNMISSVNGTSVNLEWGRPMDSGGRSDLLYSVLCQKCSGEWGQCEDWMGSTRTVDRSGVVPVRFVPRQSLLTEPWVTVLNLVAHANYTFRILAMNAVTHLSNEPAPFISVNITTNQAAPSQVIAIRQENTSQNSVTLQWHEPDQPNGVILEYDIKYYEKDKEQQSYSTLKAKGTTARVSGLKPGTRYIFQVRARTSAGCGRFSQNVEIQTGKAIYKYSNTTGQNGAGLKSHECQWDQEPFRQSLNAIDLCFVTEHTHILTQTGCVVVCPVPLRYDTMTIIWICMALVSGLVTFLAIVICRKRQGNPFLHYTTTRDVDESSLTLRHSYTYVEYFLLYLNKGSSKLYHCLHRIPLFYNQHSYYSVGRAWLVPFQDSEFDSWDHPSINNVCKHDCKVHLIKDNCVFSVQHSSHSRVWHVFVSSGKSGHLPEFLHGLIITAVHVSKITMLMFSLIPLLLSFDNERKTVRSVVYPRVTLNYSKLLFDIQTLKAFQDPDEEKMHYQNGHGMFVLLLLLVYFYCTPSYSSSVYTVHFPFDSDLLRYKISVLHTTSLSLSLVSSSCVIKSVEEGYRLPAPMGCSGALHTLMLDCWQKDRNERPRFCQIVTVLDKLIRNPENLKSMNTLCRLGTPPMMDRSIPDFSSCSSVDEWLDTIKMGRYKDHFAAGGYLTLGHVIGMNQGDIHRLGVTLMGHQKKIMTSVQLMRVQVLNRSVPSVHV
ncbi:unnamed protein product [Oncorhynchus mykiss]|uniref:Receptor protein-tyrosine kinase n=1 Tax=Oncorhynchus mykiss TaxID=8022 RepID=A0A060WH52_ONCMY|nr:unnamed protein product [Oncorhynchus mykiss]